MKTRNQVFLEELNRAFANSNTSWIADHVTDDIRWEIIGDRIIEGKPAFVEALKEMASPEPLKMTIHHIITHGKHASVNGVMTTPDGSSYGFCDVITFSGFKNPKVSKMTSYAIELK
jgi:hypothetical protein